MAQWGRCEYKQLLKLKENIDRLQSADMDKFCRDASKELAARLLKLVIEDTPVGEYPAETGKNGGTLRRGWTAKTHAEAETRETEINPAVYAKSLPVYKKGTKYYIEVINPVEYASYVEFGHRQEPGRYVPAIGKRLVNAWVPGQYFLTNSERIIREKAQGILEKKLEKLLRETFRV